MMNGIDLNDTVTVTLTKRGAEILNEQNEFFNNAQDLEKLNTDYKAGGDYRDALRRIMGRFGGYTYDKKEPVFTNLRKV